MPVNIYEDGAMITISGVFADSAGTELDPTTLVFYITDPSGNTMLYAYGTAEELVQDSAGNYHIDILVDEPGNWEYRWVSDGVGRAAEPGRFRAAVTNIIPQ